MPLSVEEHENGWRRFTLSACPLDDCGHIFERDEPRWKHILEEHGPEDAGLSAIGERPEGVNEPLFTPVEDLPGGEARDG